MNIKEWIAEIINPIKTLSNLNLLLDVQGVTTKQEKRSIRLSFPSFVTEGAIRFSKFVFGEIGEYMELLRNRLYSAILIDGSLIQMSLHVHQDIIIKHRYCYYPCPVKFKGDELKILIEEEPLIDIIETSISRQTNDLLLRTPFRFDFNSRRWKEGEPHAHVHFNHSACRCALIAPIYPSYFIKFIMRFFYPDIWDNNQILESLDQEMPGYWLKDDEKRFLHFAAIKE